MKGASEEALLHSQYTFSLRAPNHKKSTLDVEHLFEPIRCQKSDKVYSAVPSYHSECALPFQTEADLPVPSLRIEQEDTQKSSTILTPKPTTRFCQVCKEKFEDYLKHISHPLHRQKAQQAHNSLDFHLLKELLAKSASKKRTTPTQQVSFQDKELLSETTSIVCSEEQNTEENFLFGSKKRIIVNDDGDLEAVSLSGSTKGIEDEGFVAVRRSQRQTTLLKESKV